MSNLSERIDQLPPLQRAVFALKELRAQLDAVEQVRTEPIAVVGIGCRFPGGVRSPDDFWRLLRDGVDAVADVLPERWDLDRWYDPTPGMPGKMSTKRGGFLTDLDQFDPLFFGMAPREAVSLDPQQRLLLEVAWEALEHAGIVPERLSGTAAGVFVGVGPNEYARQVGEPEQIDAHVLTGNAVSVAAGRLAYILGLQGPTLAIDTACSSSLVAVHLACQSLRQGECRVALSGGVNVLLAPESTVALSEMRALSAAGCCQTFDAKADGYVRGEGCGLVVLKRRSDALADGDRILALIRGSAVNHDGRSASLTAPNGPAQEAVLRAALAAGKVDPAQVQYVEAHGTGTPLGDPIEVRALTAVYGPGHTRERPLLLGSVKTNVGHLEAAAGIAGLIKVVLALHHGLVPPHLHFQEPSPHLPWAELPILVPTTMTPWPGEGTRLAGISSFGFSGTNAHAVLAAAPAPAKLADVPEPPGYLLTLSARDTGALREAARRLAQHLAAHPEETLADVCFTANVCRTHFLPQRAALLVDSLAEARARLSALAEGNDVPGLWRGEVTGKLAAAASAELAAVPAISGDRDQWIKALETLGGLFVRGASIDWAALAGSPRRKVALPTYPFQRQHYWLTAPASQNGSAFVREPDQRGATLLGQRLHSALKTTLFESRFNTGSLPFLADHCVHGRVVVAGACHVALVMSAAKELLGVTSCVLSEVVFPQALVLPKEGSRVQVVLTPGETGMAFEVYSSANGTTQTPEAWGLHATGRLAAGGGEIPVYAADPSRCPELLSAAEFYRTIAEHGVELGPSFRWIAELHRGDGEAMCRMRSPSSAEEEKVAVLHPGLADSCVQMVVAAASAQLASLAGSGPFIPVGCEQVRFFGSAVLPLTAHARLQSQPQPADEFSGDVCLFGADGRIVAEWTGLRFRRAPRGAFLAERDSADALLYGLHWRPQELPTSGTPPSGRWLVLTDSERFSSTLTARLTAAGAICQREADPGNEPLAGVVFGWGLDGDMSSEPTAPEFQAAQQRGVTALLALLQALARRTGSAPRLWIITRGAQSGGGSSPLAVAAAAFWGLARVIALEIPELRCTCVDLDPTTAPTEMDGLLAEIGAAGAEDQVALRGPQRRVARLERLGAGDRPLPIPSGPSYRLQVAAIGDLASLTLRTAERRPPRDHEVQIHVCATGLNFRDVLNALGMYPGEAGPLGLECAGTIAAVGAAVREFAVGDEVLAMAADSFGAFATTDARLAAPKPGGLSFEEAATIPVVFLTAHYGLNHLAKLQLGERVLIHAAAGGVGLAAIQLAQRLGAEIYATAGSPAKRAHLRALGVQHIFDSRSLSFADDVRAATGGAGIHVVLNSLAGEFIPKSLALLAPGGRFLEIGKTDIWDREKVRKVRPDVDYHTIALDQMGLSDPAFVGSLLREMLPAFVDGTLRPLPCHDYPLVEAPAAFRFMAQARHIGKIVLTQASASIGPIRADGTYLITGGLGALGLRVARWLVEQGARHLVLVGRRAPGPEGEAALRDLELNGVHVTVARADVGRYEETAAMLAPLLPLRGIIHAAGVLDDGVVAEQTWDRFGRVLAAKAWSAWNLHLLTRDQPLDFFVLFSSAAALLGSPGQGNYAAANACLDALAQHRRALGLPAVSIAWGPWAGGGMAAHLGERERARWEARGMGMIEPEHGMELFGRLLRRDEPNVAVLPVEWSRYLRPYGSSVPPWLSGLSASVAPSAAQRTDFLDRLRETPAGSRRPMLTGLLREQASRVLGLRIDAIADDRPLHELGLDSLLTVELRNVVGAALGRTLPATVLFNYPNIDALSGWLETELFGQELPAIDPDAEIQQRLEAEVADLSEAELDNLLEGFAEQHLKGTDA